MRRTHLLISCPFFGGGEVGPSFHSFIHSFIVQFLLYFLQRRTEMFFLPTKVGSNFHPFPCTCVHANFATCPSQGKPPPKVPQS
jgi:hypothetical protein